MIRAHGEFPPAWEVRRSETTLGTQDIIGQRRDGSGSSISEVRLGDWQVAEEEGTHMAARVLLGDSRTRPEALP